MLAPLAAGFGWGKAKEQEEKAKKEQKEAREEGRAPSPKPWWGGNAAMGLGALAVAGAAASAYMRRDDLATGWNWGAEHMTFVRNLWDAGALRKRLDQIHELQNTRNVSFAK